MFFPAGLQEYFDLKSHREFVIEKTNTPIWEFVFEEKNQIPKDLNPGDYEAKDFVEKTIVDLPIRGRAVQLVIRRRRWRHKSTGQIVKRDLTFIAEGGKFTAELADFLKGGD